MKTVPAIVLVPGMQCTERMFVPMIEALRRAVPEIPLYVRPVRQQDLRSAAAEALEGFEQPVILVGHSLGGTVAMAAARMFPEAAAGLVLLCSNPRPPRIDQISYWTGLQEEVAAGSSGRTIERIVSQLVHGEESETSSVHWATICREMADETGEQAFLAQLGIQLARIDERPGLGRFVGPVLAIAAGNDALVNMEDAKEAFAAAHGQFEVVPGASHMAPLTHPGIIAAILAEWILYQFMTDRTAEATRRVLL